MSRRTYVMRCSSCDGVEHAADARLYKCPKCDAWTYGSMDAADAPLLHVDEHVPVVSDLYMDGVRATDGTDIGSRAKRRAWMKKGNLADCSDFTNVWAKAEKERTAIRTGTNDRKARRESIERAMHRFLKP